MHEEESLQASSENKHIEGMDLTLGQTVPTMAAATGKAQSPTVDRYVSYHIISYVKFIVPHCTI